MEVMKIRLDFDVNSEHIFDDALLPKQAINVLSKTDIIPNH